MPLPLGSLPSTTGISLADIMRYQSEHDAKLFSVKVCFQGTTYDLEIPRDAPDRLQAFRQAIEAAVCPNPEDILATAHPSLLS